MTAPAAPKVSKWPFILGDVLLLAVATWISAQSPDPFRAAPLFFLVLSVCLGAWLCVTPFLSDHRAALKLAESGSLATTVDQIRNVRTVAEQITVATAQWQILQEQSSKTASAAHEIGNRMSAEAKAFAEFMQKANDTEKTHLRLEVDKLRRGEGEWLQALVRILDHVYALHQAGVRSGQPALTEQLGHFQNACREAARRLGVLAFEAEPGEPFNEKTHQLADPEARPPSQARVAETLATGYTFQGQFLRPALVALEPAAEPQILPEPSNAETA
jgi:molecular chaperone GrpE (heat shock protein)